LNVPTTRGDRLFISLLAAAFLHLAWIGSVGANTIATLPFGDGLEVSSLWLATLISLAMAAAVFRWV
jgi:predicted small integral membrane protein